MSAGGQGAGGARVPATDDGDLLSRGMALSQWTLRADRGSLRWQYPML